MKNGAQMQTWDLPGFRALVAATTEYCILHKTYMAELPKEGKKRNCPERETTLKPLAKFIPLQRSHWPCSVFSGGPLQNICQGRWDASWKKPDLLHCPGFLETPCPLSSHPLWSFPSPITTYSKNGRKWPRDRSAVSDLGQHGL